MLKRDHPMKRMTILGLVFLSQTLALPAFARVTYKCPSLDRDHISQLAISKSLVINNLILKPLDAESIQTMKSATKNVSDAVDVKPQSEYDNFNGVCIYQLSVNGNPHGSASIVVRSES